MTTKFIPRTNAGSGTRFGTSFLNTFANCPRKWFNQYHRPIFDEEGVAHRGLAPKWTAEALLRGSIFHEGIAEWYKSGIRNGEDTGQRDIDRACDVAALTGKDRMSEFEDDSLCFTEIDAAKALLRKYHDHYGPGSYANEFPQIRVVCDGLGEPLIERAWEFPLGDGYVFTCRTDAIVWDRGVLKSLEHKTSSMPWMRLKTIPTDAQFAGEQWILRQIFPEDPIAGTLVNVIGTKKASGKFDRESTSRTVAQLERWRENCIWILNQIELAKEGFEVELNRGVSIERAADMWFPDHGTRTDHCTAYTGCDFLELCSWAGREEQRLNMYRRKAA